MNTRQPGKFLSTIVGMEQYWLYPALLLKPIAFGDLAAAVRKVFSEPEREVRHSTALF